MIREYCSSKAKWNRELWNNMYNPIKPSKNPVLSLIQKTWDSPYLNVTMNAYAVFKRKFSAYEVDHTDGIGTKGYYHWQRKTFKNAVMDALAMNLNDLAMVGATPYKLQNHIVLPEDDTKAIIAIVKSLVSQCEERNIVITGGETSIQDTSIGMDLSITVSGFVKKILHNRFQEGDVLIGLASNGLHSNGITKVRELFGEEFKNDFVIPTKIYSDLILPLFKEFELHGRMHITGGAYTKLKDLLDGLDVVIESNELMPQNIFYEIYKKGVQDKEMYTTFNCGVGFVLSVPKQQVQKLIAKTGGKIIGYVTTGTGKIKIHSSFSDKRVIL